MSMKNTLTTFALTAVSFGAAAQSKNDKIASKMTKVDDCHVVYADTVITKKGDTLCTKIDYDFCDGTFTPTYATFKANKTAMSSISFGKMADVTDPQDKKLLEQAQKVYATKPGVQ